MKCFCVLRVVDNSSMLVILTQTILGHKQLLSLRTWSVDIQSSLIWNLNSESASSHLHVSFYYIFKCHHTSASRDLPCFSESNEGLRGSCSNSEFFHGPDTASAQTCSCVRRKYFPLRPISSVIQCDRPVCQWYVSPAWNPPSWNNEWWKYVLCYSGQPLAGTISIRTPPSSSPMLYRPPKPLAAKHKNEYLRNVESLPGPSFQETHIRHEVHDLHNHFLRHIAQLSRGSSCTPQWTWYLRPSYSGPSYWYHLDHWSTGDCSLGYV